MLIVFARWLVEGGFIRVAARGKSDLVPLPNSELPPVPAFVKLKSKLVGSKRVPPFAKRHPPCARASRQHL